MSQRNNILAHLKSGRTITATEALERFGCFRLAARICELQRMGHNIDSVMVHLINGKRVARYRLVKNGK